MLLQCYGSTTKQLIETSFMRSYLRGKVVWVDSEEGSVMLFPHYFIVLDG